MCMYRNARNYIRCCHFLTTLTSFFSKEEDVHVTSKNFVPVHGVHPKRLGVTIRGWGCKCHIFHENNTKHMAKKF